MRYEVIRLVRRERGRFPGLVVIHEIYGLNENIKEIARRLAGEGYVALAVDLYDIKIYPEARHSFFNDEGEAYDAAASEDSWRRVLAFFAEHLGAAP